MKHSSAEAQENSCYISVLDKSRDWFWGVPSAALRGGSGYVDELRFDGLARALGGSGSRRQALAALVAGLGSTLLLTDVEAKRKKRKKKKKPQPPLPTPCNAACPAGQVCCGDACLPGNCCSAAQCTDAARSVCENNVCVAGACTNRCPAGQVCCGAACVPGDCCTRAECTDASRALCLNNTCAPCTASQQCGAGRVCCSGECRAVACCRDADCPDLECRTNKRCTDNICQYTNLSNGAQCSTGRCCNGVCPPPPTCLPFGACCVDGPDCQNRCCTRQSATTQPSCPTGFFCGPRLPGGPCGSDSDCVSSVCSCGACCAQSGSFCRSNPECCSGTCSQFQCT